MAIQKVGVIGCGLMGSGIAQVSAQAGFTTIVREVSPNALEKGIGSIHKFLQAGIDKGKVPPFELDKVKKNLSGTVELKDLADCDLVIEAATENLALKRELFGALDSICKPEAIFASNTSSLSITEMSMFTKRPAQVIGLHFFNPVPLMKLVEVVKTVQTSPEALQAINAASTASRIICVARRPTCRASSTMRCRRSCRPWDTSCASAFSKAPIGNAAGGSSDEPGSVPEPGGSPGGGTPAAALSGDAPVVLMPGRCPSG